MHNTDSDEELMDPEEGEVVEVDDPRARCATSLPFHKPDYPIGSFVIAVFDRLWYIAQVERKEMEEECTGFTS
jgi:hypothetical protein